MSATARCGCGSTTCSCAIQGGSGVSVTGVGTLARPYVVNIDAGKIAVDDTPTIDMRLIGSGTSADYYHLSAALTAKIDDLTDVLAPAPANGNVLAYDSASGQWKPVPPVTAAPGAINAGNGITGDGSSVTPLTAKPNAAAGIQVDANGIGLQSGIMAAINSIAALPKVVAGQSSLVFTKENLTSTAVVFPAGVFTGTPRVVATARHSYFFPSVTGESKTGFTLWGRIYNDALPTSTITVNWIAVQSS